MYKRCYRCSVSGLDVKATIKWKRVIHHTGPNTQYSTQMSCVQVRIKTSIKARILEICLQVDIWSMYIMILPIRFRTLHCLHTEAVFLFIHHSTLMCENMSSIPLNYRSYGTRFWGIVLWLLTWNRLHGLIIRMHCQICLD